MPFVVIQVIMVLLVIVFPAMVMHYKGAASTIDPNKVKIEIPQIDMPRSTSPSRRSRLQISRPRGHEKRAPERDAPGLVDACRALIVRAVQARAAHRAS